MENQSLSVVARLIAVLAISASALAADGGTAADQSADWQQRLDKAAALQAEARSRRVAADQLLEDTKADCFKKFRVTACQDEARSEHQGAMREARRLENEGKALEREVRKEQLTDKDKRRAETARQHEAELKVRETETAAARQTAEAETAAALAGKARKAAEGERRKAAAEEKQRKKRADHEARIAEKSRKAERQAAEAAGK
jgi:colicin import membrane protein